MYIFVFAFLTWNIFVSPFFIHLRVLYCLLVVDGCFFSFYLLSFFRFAKTNPFRTRIVNLFSLGNLWRYHVFIRLAENEAKLKANMSNGKGDWTMNSFFPATSLSTMKYANDCETSTNLANGSYYLCSHCESAASSSPHINWKLFLFTEQ